MGEGGGVVLNPALLELGLPAEVAFFLFFNKFLVGFEWVWLRKGGSCCFPFGRDAFIDYLCLELLFRRGFESVSGLVGFWRSLLFGRPWRRRTQQVRHFQAEKSKSHPKHCNPEVQIQIGWLVGSSLPIFHVYFRVCHFLKI